MVINNLFMDYGGLLAEYIFNQQTLERAHTFMSKKYSLSLKELNRAHKKAIDIYLKNRSDTLKEWTLEKIFLQLPKWLQRQDISLEDLCDIYKHLDHDENIYKSVFDILSRIKRVTKLHIISNLPHTSLIGTLANSDKLHLFDTITISCHIGYRKPHPKIYEAAFFKAQADKKHSLFISHDQMDLNGAEALSIPSMLILPETFDRIEEIIR